MPLLKIETNIAYPQEKRDRLLREVSAAVASMLGKPETYVMVTLNINPDMLFSGEEAPLVYLELKSIGLPDSRTSEFSATLCRLMTEHLSVEAKRIYIEFSKAARNMWGWDGGTF